MQRIKRREACEEQVKNKLSFLFYEGGYIKIASFKTFSAGWWYSIIVVLGNCIKD